MPQALLRLVLCLCLTLWPSHATPRTAPVNPLPLPLTPGLLRRETIALALPQATGEAVSVRRVYQLAGLAPLQAYEVRASYLGSSPVRVLLSWPEDDDAGALQTALSGRRLLDIEKLVFRTNVHAMPSNYPAERRDDDAGGGGATVVMELVLDGIFPAHTQTDVSVPFSIILEPLHLGVLPPSALWLVALAGAVLCVTLLWALPRVLAHFSTLGKEL